MYKDAMLFKQPDFYAPLGDVLSEYITHDLREEDENVYMISLQHTSAELEIANAVFHDKHLWPQGYMDSLRCRVHLRFGYDPIEVIPHYDDQPAFLVQIENHKRFLFFPPLQERHLPWERSIRSPSNSVVTKSPRTHPDDFRDARAVAHVVQPGELLHIPPLWWHYVDLRVSNSTPRNNKACTFWSSLSMPYCYDGYNGNENIDTNRATFPRAYGHRAEIYPC